MRKTFEKYFIASVFILISGVFQLQANSIAGQERDTPLSQYCDALPHTSTAATILPFSSDFNFNLGQILLEETELNEYDHIGERPDATPDFHYLGLTAFIFNFYLKNWKLKQLRKVSFTQNYQPFFHTHCKRYIQLEVFRI